jgi:small basic protein
VLGAVLGLAVHGATKEAVKNIKEAATFAAVGAVVGAVHTTKLEELV